MKLMPLSDERRSDDYEDFDMNCENKSKDSVFPSPCKSSIVNGFGISRDDSCVNGTSKIEVQKKVLSENSDTEKNTEPHEKPELLTNGDVRKVLQNGNVSNGVVEKITENGSRNSPTPSAMSESEEIKLCYSSDAEEDPKQLASLNDMDIESSKVDEATDANLSSEEPMEIEESGPEPVPEVIEAKYQSKCDLIAKPEQTDIENTSFNSDTEIKKNDTVCKLNETDKCKSPSEQKITAESDVKSSEQNCKSDPEIIKSTTKEINIKTPETSIDNISESVKENEKETDANETTKQIELFNLPKKIKSDCTISSSEPKIKVSADDTVPLCDETCDGSSGAKGSVSKTSDDLLNTDNPFFEESVDISSSSDQDNDSVANIIKKLENDGNESDASSDGEIAAEDISNIANDNTGAELDRTSPDLKSSQTVDTAIEVNLETKVNAETNKDIKIEPATCIKEALDAKENTELSKNSTKTIDNGESEKCEPMATDDIKMKDTEVDDKLNSQVKATKIIHGENRSGKRSFDSDTSAKAIENDTKKMKIDDKATSIKTDDAMSEDLHSTDDVDLFSRLKVKSLSKGDFKQEKIKPLEKVQEMAKPSMSKNFFNLALTEEELKAMGSVTRMTKKDLEKLVVSKTLETLSLRSKLAARNQEVLVMQEKVAEYKKKIQPLNKQVHDLSNVIIRLEQGMNKNGKPARPLKVTRSVGLQVSFNGSGNMTPKMSANAPPVRQGVKTLRPVQRPPASVTNQSPNPKPSVASVSQLREAQKTLRVALPGSNLRTHNPNVPTSNCPVVTSPRIPAPLPPTMTKVTQSLPTISTVPMSSLQSPTSQNTAVVMPRQNTRCIDLTSVEDRSGVRTTQIPTITSGQQYSLVQNSKFSIIPPQGLAKPGATPVAYLVQSPQSGPVLLTPSGQAASQSLSSLNLNSVQWVKNMPTNVGNQSQSLIRPLNTNTNIRPNQMTMHPTSQGVPLQRGALYTVGPTVASIQRNHPSYLPNRMQHPAPLPAVPPHPPTRPGWKLPPPKPILKISKVQNGIVLSWNMSISGEYEDMKSYQIYAYQETKDPPSSSLWKTVGDVKALALPMACTLTQFKEGHKYHFSVRAVDVHSRMGQNSDPTSIVLIK